MTDSAVATAEVVDSPPDGEFEMDTAGVDPQSLDDSTSDGAEVQSGIKDESEADSGEAAEAGEAADQVEGGAAGGDSPAHTGDTAAAAEAEPGDAVAEPANEAADQPIVGETEGKSSKRERAMDAIAAKIRDQLGFLNLAKGELMDAKESQKEAKQAVDAEQAKLNDLCRQLGDIERGEWQEPLPFKDAGDEAEGAGGGEADSEPAGNESDPADETPVSELGMTEKETEKLEDFGCDTISQLEETIRKDALWHRKVNGFGPAKVDKLMDKLLEWRKENPVPAD